MPPMALPPLPVFQDKREQAAGIESPADSVRLLSAPTVYNLKGAQHRVHPFALLRAVCYIGR